MNEQLISVSCNHCGAPLSVPTSARFVTCNYCDTRLEVCRSDSAAYTQVLESLDQRTQQIAADVDELKRQSEIERLDREWQMRRDSLLVRSRNGGVSEPSMFGGAIVAIIVVVWGIIWTLIAMSMGAPFFMPLFGLLFIIFGVGTASSTMNKAAQFREAQRTYLNQRNQLMQERAQTESAQSMPARGS